MWMHAEEIVCVVHASALVAMNAQDKLTYNIIRHVRIYFGNHLSQRWRQKKTTRNLWKCISYLFFERTFDAIVAHRRRWEQPFCIYMWIDFSVVVRCGNKHHASFKFDFGISEACQIVRQKMKRTARSLRRHSALFPTSSNIIFACRAFAEILCIIIICMLSIHRVLKWSPSTIK